MKRMKKLVVLTLALAMSLMSTLTVLADSVNFIADTDGTMLQIPETYTVERSIKNLGDYGALSKAEDVVYKDGKLYVADSGNNRVLRMSTTGEVDLEITAGGGIDLNGPKGVFVKDDGEIWIADTGNLRIVVVDKDGKDVRVLEKPDSEVLGDNVTFDIEKICVNDMGYIFALKGANIMKMNSKNEFLNYMGATNVGFSFTRFLIRTFGTDAQRKSTEKPEPTAYNNFTLGADGNIYGVLAEGTSGQIRRLNSVGENTYPENAYGFTFFKAGSLYPTEPAFKDIAVDANGIITVLDRGTGLLYQYDTEGNLLTAFGGIGSKNGMFSVPTALDVDEKGNLYVLDNNANNIQVFEPTGFIDQVHQAIILQAGGHYDEAKGYWEAVLNIDSNYAVAHKALGKILYKEEAYSESMDNYEQANDTAGYSDSFDEVRHNFLRNYFFIVVVVVVIIVIIIGKLFVTIKRKADKWSFNIEMRGDMDK